MDKTIRDRYSDAILHETMARYAIAADQIEPGDGFESFIYRCQRDGTPAILRITHSLRRSPELIRGEVDWINYLAAGGATVAGALHAPITARPATRSRNRRKAFRPGGARGGRS